MIVRRAIGVLLGVFFAGAIAATDLPVGIIALDGRPAPALRLADMDGKFFDLASLRGKWVMVHFWASWCGPCRREMPLLAALQQEIGEGQPRLVLVNTAEREDDVFAFLAVVAPNLTTMMDPDGLMTDLWQPRGLPATFFVDPGGKLRYLALGGRPWNKAEYQAFVRSLRAKKP